MTSYSLGGHEDAIEAEESALEADSGLAIVYRRLSTQTTPGGEGKLTRRFLWEP